MGLHPHRRLGIITIFCLLGLNVVPILAFDPRPQGGIYSEIDWGVYVQLLYGSLDGNSVFIPQQANNLPSPTLWIVMGGMEQYGSRNITITSYLFNKSTNDYSTEYKTTIYTLRMGDGGDLHFAIRQISFPSTNTSMRVIFNYLDIEVEFFYKPLPIYIDVETTRAEFQTAIEVWIFITIIVGVAAEYPARKLQRHVVAVPGLPVLSILAIATSISAMIFVITYLSFPFGFFEKIILFVLSADPLFIEIPFFILFLLWLAHRHSPDNLRTLQMYYSKFIPKEGRDIWKADMRDDYRGYEKDGKWYVCDPDSWSQFFWRLIGFRILMKKHHQSIKPDEGVWKKNDERLWISLDDLVIEGGLKPNFHKDMQGMIQTGGIVIIGLICILAAAINVIPELGPSKVVLYGVGVVIMIIGIVGKGSLFELSYDPRIWNFSVIKYREWEQIMVQYVNFQEIRKKVSMLSAEIATISANFHSNVIFMVAQFVQKINTMLLHHDVIFEVGEAPGPKEDIEEFKARKEKEKAKEEEPKK